MADDLSTLAEAAFAGVVFPVSQITSDGGNDAAEHTAYLRPGADIEPTGRKAYRFRMTIPLVNAPALVARYGQLFPAKRADLLQAFADTPIATLSHPTFGAFDAFAADWSEDLSADTRSGVSLSVTFVEHNASASLLISDDGAAPTDASASAQRLADDADAKIAALNAAQTTYPAVTGDLGTSIGDELEVLESGTLAFSQMAAAFTRMLTACSDVLSQRAMGLLAAHDAAAAVLDLRRCIYGLRSQYMPDLDAVRSYTVPQTMAAWEIALSVYGDASLGRLILAANSITDPLAVPAGRVLTILPAT